MAELRRPEHAGEGGRVTPVCEISNGGERRRPLKRGMRLIDRFFSNVSFERGGTGCWMWHGPTERRGYGRFTIQTTYQRAHRVSWSIFRGVIPVGMVLDHLCKNTSCVNPAHLEPVTQRENLARSDSPSGEFARRLACGKGHPLSGDNLTWHRGSRRCRACAREWSATTRKRAGRMTVEERTAMGWNANHPLVKKHGNSGL